MPIPPGGRNFVHIRDVATGIVRCLENGENGEKYLLAGDNLSYELFFKKVFAKVNLNPVFIKIPKFICMSIGIFGDILKKLKIKTLLDSSSMEILCTNTFYSNRKSIEKLNIHYHSIDDAIEEALIFFKEYNYY